jgi:hypothetical protein
MLPAAQTYVCVGAEVEYDNCAANDDPETGTNAATGFKLV